MKCPKCNYLGFETGDRCKNCGYDFSLIEEPENQAALDLDVDLTFRPSDDTLPASVKWDDHFEAFSSEAAPEVTLVAESPARLEMARPAPEPPPASALPRETARLEQKLSAVSGASLFDEGDEPLIKLPATPRAPLAVRRTPDTPRLRAVPRPVPRPSRPIETSPALNFVDEAPDAAAEAPVEPRPRAAPIQASRVAHAIHPEVSGPLARLGAAVIDHSLLGAIDLTVVYFTLRMAGLTMADLSLLPLAPLVTFLMLVKLSYFTAFTAVGGQTIGKMAARIRVVTAEDEIVDGPLAAKRTLAGVASAALLGLGFVPALFGSERRALHDRLTHTRVVTLPSA